MGAHTRPGRPHRQPGTFGMLRTLSVGILTDRLGRRRIMLASITGFSICMLITAFAPSAEVFGFLRFLTGLGLGGIVPTCIALTVEYARKERRQSPTPSCSAAIRWAASGHPCWRSTSCSTLTSAGCTLSAPCRWSPFCRSRGNCCPNPWPTSPASAHRGSERHGGALRPGLLGHRFGPGCQDRHGGEISLKTLSPKWVRSTILFALANFCGLLLVYGLNTWLPQIMRQAGFNLGDSLTPLLVLNAGASSAP